MKAAPLISLPIVAVAVAFTRESVQRYERTTSRLTGALPALFGPRAVYATIEAVETFVDTHYADQVAMIDALPPSEAAAAAQLPALRNLLETCRLDEVAHRDDAHARRGAEPASVFARVWAAVVGSGSAAAVRVSRHV